MKVGGVETGLRESGVVGALQAGGEDTVAAGQVGERGGRGGDGDIAGVVEPVELNVGDRRGGLATPGLRCRTGRDARLTGPQPQRLHAFGMGARAVPVRRGQARRPALGGRHARVHGVDDDAAGGVEPLSHGPAPSIRGARRRP